MRTRFTLALAILILTYPLVLRGDNASASDHSVYFALGDSVAAGVGSSLPRTRSYPAIVGDWIAALDGERSNVRNLAVPGETAASFIADGQLAAFEDALDDVDRQEANIRLVTISLGGNEILNLEESGNQERESGFDEFRASLAEAVQAVRSAVGSDVPIALTTYYDVTGGDPDVEFSDSWWVEQFNQVIRTAAEETGSTVAELQPAFEGEIERLTRYPVDVHPTNQGYRAIAREVWRGLEFDRTAPGIAMEGSATFDRDTPTFRVTVEDNVGVDEVSIEMGSGNASPLIPQGDGLFVSLLDLRNVTDAQVEIAVSASDFAGNTTSEQKTFAFEE